MRGIPRTPDRYNQFGGTIGGPIWIPKVYNGRNKTFFFYNFDQTLQHTPSIVTQTVPAATFKSGDFSASPIAVLDPRSGTPFPNNVIPNDRINPAAAKVMSLLPLPNASGTADPQNSRSINNWIFPQTLVVTAPRNTARVDHSAGDKLRLFGSINSWATNNANAASLNSILNANATGWRNGYEAALGLTDLISPTLIADFRFGFNRWIEQAQYTSVGTNVEQSLGIGTAPAPLPPNLSIASWVGIGPAAGSSKNSYSNTFQWLGAVTKVLAAHTIKAGFEIRRDQFNSFTPPSFYMGQYTFGGSITNNGNVGGNAINSLADFLLGAVTSAQYEIPQPLTGRRNTNYGIFVQDDWKVNDRLTVNAGLRWDYETPMSIVNNIYSRFDPVSGQLLVAGKNASPALNISTPGMNFGPRLGLAYAARPKTIIRAAGGIFYSQIMSNLGASVNFPGYDTIQSFPQPGPGLAQPFSLSQGMPLIGTQDLSNPFQVLGQATLASPVNAGVSFSQVNPLPSVMQWNFGIQQEFWRQSVLEINYVGNAAQHLPLFLSGNNLPFDQGVNLARIGVATTTQASRPFPLVSGITGLYDAGHSSYQSLQVSARKQLSSSLAYQAAYTWSKSIDDGSGIFPFSQPNGISAGQFPIYFRNLDRSVSAFDLTHRFSFAGQYRTRGPRWIRNFQIAPVFVAQTGLPLTVTQSNFYPGVSAQRPMVTGNESLNLASSYPNGQGVQSLTPPTSAGFPLSPSGPIFIGQGTSRQQIVSGAIGDLGRYTVRAPGSINLNLSLSRRFQVAERVSLQFRVDAFNALNRVNFASPATTLSVATQGTSAIFNSPGFGLITSAASGRFLQIVTRIDF